MECSYFSCFSFSNNFFLSVSFDDGQFNYKKVTQSQSGVWMRVSELTGLVDVEKLFENTIEKKHFHSAWLAWQVWVLGHLAI